MKESLLQAWCGYNSFCNKRLTLFLAGLLVSFNVLAEVSPADLFAPLRYGSVTISPTGKYMAVTQQLGGENYFQVYTNPGNKRVFNYAMGGKRAIRFMQWVNDRALVFGYNRSFMNIADAGGWTTELLSFDVKKLKLERLPDGVLLHTLPEDPDHILIAGVGAKYPEAYRVNVYNGTSRRAARAAAPDGTFVSDHKGNVVFSTGTNASNVQEVYMRKGRGRWKLVESHKSDEAGWMPVSAGPTPNTFYTSDWRDGGTAGLGVYDVEKDVHNTLFQFDEVDIDGFYRDHDYKVYAVTSHLHYPSTHYVNNAHPLARILSELQRLNPNETVWLTSNSKDNKKAIALISSDRNPGHYLLIDLDADQKVKMLFRRNPELKPEMLAPMHPIELQTRDKAKIYGYVTSAKDTPKPGPMVVILHGGPHGIRDIWGFNSEVQLLATRGVHVLQVNFRGSGGYGINYEKAGYGEWGGIMQDDVTDATRWAIDSGVADPERICVMGGSYGAYSALMGAAKEPDLYNCAVGLFGIYDLTIMDTTGDIKDNDWGRAFLRHVLDMSDDDLRLVSPNHQAGKIKARVMLGHGGQDRRAPPVHARLMRDALKKAGNDPVWYFKEAQFHGFIGEKAQTELYQNVGRFLSESLQVPQLDLMAEAETEAAESGGH